MSRIRGVQSLELVSFYPNMEHETRVTRVGHVSHTAHQFFSVYEDSFENFGDDFDLELLNPAPFDQISSKMIDENDQSNNLNLPPPAILLTQNAKNGDNVAKSSLKTLKIKLATLMNHVANVLKNVEDQGSKDNGVGLDW